MDNLLNEILNFLHNEYGFDISDYREIDNNTLVVDGREILIVSDDKATELAEDIIIQELSEIEAVKLAQYSETDKNLWKTIKSFKDRYNKLKELNRLDIYLNKILDEYGRESFINSFDGKEHQFGDMVMYVLG